MLHRTTGRCRGMNASCRERVPRTQWRWRCVQPCPTLSNLVQPWRWLCRGLIHRATYPQGDLSTGRLIHRARCWRVSTSWIFFQLATGCHAATRAGGMKQCLHYQHCFSFQPRARGRDRVAAVSHVGNEVPATRARAICQSARFLPAGRRLPLAKKRQWQKAGVVGNCNLAAELQWRAGLQAAIPILSANSNQSCNSKLEKFTSFGNTRSFGKFPIRAAFLTDSVFLNENPAGSENCQTT